MAAAVLATGLASEPALAGSFQLNERSTKALGGALSGSVSAASDVTFASFNPAALSRVENAEIGGNLSAILLKSEATAVSGPFTGAREDGGRDAIVPSFAGGYRINEDLVVGLTSYAPFGLKSVYDEAPFFFDARTSELRTVVIAPTLSYEINETLAVGGSIDVLYVDARLTNAGLHLDGETVSVGFSLGLLWEPVEGTQIGAAYHHGYDLDIDTAILGPQFPAGLQGTASASLPNWGHLGITQAIGEQWRVMAEARYINWSSFDAIDVTTGGFPIGSEVQGYEDAFFLSAGTEYDVTGQLTLRGGIAFDQTPTTDADRTIRVADEDRLWFSVGASYRLTDAMSLDFAYNYLHAINDPVVTMRNGPANGTRLEYDTAAHLISIGGSLRF